MILRKHFELEGRHSHLSPSTPHWVNYSEEKFDRVFMMKMAAKRGDDLHDLAMRMIRLRVKLDDKPKTLNMYVNDAIGYRMTPEQKLAYSDNAFGTADALSFRDNFLRIHDLKTGFTPAKITQLEIYCALFCLEYQYRPFEIGMEMRIYQNDAVQIFEADPDVIFRYMEKIKFFDKRINQMQEELLS